MSKEDYLALAAFFSAAVFTVLSIYYSTRWSLFLQFLGRAADGLDLIREKLSRQLRGKDPSGSHEITLDYQSLVSDHFRPSHHLLILMRQSAAAEKLKAIEKDVVDTIHPPPAASNESYLDGNVAIREQHFAIEALTEERWKSWTREIYAIRPERLKLAVIGCSPLLLPVLLVTLVLTIPYFLWK